MAIKTIGELKTFFQTNDKPTQEQFYDWLESYRHLLDKIVFTDLDPALQAMITAIPAGSGRPQEVSATGNIVIDMLPKYKLVGIAVKNPSAFDLVFHLSYPGLTPVPGEPWVAIEVAANSTVDVQINQTFWALTSISCNEQTGVDFSGTPLTFLIDRK